MSLSALVLLYLAPTIGSLLQLGLSRTREYDADLEGARAHGRSARARRRHCEKLERYQGSFWEDLMFPVPSRRIPQPSLLRSHPPTEQRVARLLALEGRQLPRPSRWWRSRWCRWSAGAPPPCSRATAFRACGSSVPLSPLFPRGEGEGKGRSLLRRLWLPSPLPSPHREKTMGRGERARHYPPQRQALEGLRDRGAGAVATASDRSKRRLPPPPLQDFWPKRRV